MTVSQKAWKKVKLKDIVHFKNKKRIPLKKSVREKMEKKYPYYGASGIIDYVDDYIFDEELILLGEDGANILNRTTPLCYVAKGKYWVNNHAHVMKPKHGADIVYLSEYLENLDYKKYNTGTAQPKLNLKTVKNIEVLLPPIEEQQKIASILSTWDEAIESYQLLLEEKNKIQKGFVQKILHKNIQKWPKKKVGQIFDNITRGYVLSRKKVLEEPKGDYIYPVYSSQTLDDGLLGYYNDYLFENALTWTTDGANAGTVNYREKKFYCTNVCGVLISEKGYANKLMASILNSVTHRYVSYVGNPKLMNNVMQDIVIPLPPLEIQEEVSNVLNLMDREIELLEKLIAKLKEQKRGLMQLLLTGKVRE